jgi:hypothetical protein
MAVQLESQAGWKDAGFVNGSGATGDGCGGEWDDGVERQEMTEGAEGSGASPLHASVAHRCMHASDAHRCMRVDEGTEGSSALRHGVSAAVSVVECRVVQLRGIDALVIDGRDSRLDPTSDTGRLLGDTGRLPGCPARGKIPPSSGLPAQPWGLPS